MAHYFSKTDTAAYIRSETILSYETHAEKWGVEKRKRNITRQKRRIDLNRDGHTRAQSSNGTGSGEPSVFDSQTFLKIDAQKKKKAKRKIMVILHFFEGSKYMS